MLNILKQLPYHGLLYWLNPVPPKLCYIIYYQGYERYPFLGRIRFNCRSYTPVTHLLIARQSLSILTDHLIYYSVLCESLWYFSIVMVQCCLTDCTQGKILLKIQYTSSPFNHFRVLCMFPTHICTKDDIKQWMVFYLKYLV